MRSFFYLMPRKPQKKSRKREVRSGRGVHTSERKPSKVRHSFYWVSGGEGDDTLR